jgi:hypothetical protein
MPQFHLLSASSSKTSASVPTFSVASINFVDKRVTIHVVSVPYKIASDYLTASFRLAFFLFRPPGMLFIY